MALVTTTLGDIDDSLLVKTEGVFEDDNERTTWVEYRLTPDGEIIHRSVSVYLKKGLLAESAVGGF